MKRNYLLALICLSLTACGISDLQKKGTYFHIKNEGAVMPVWIRGNVKSGTFILTIHGGPGMGTSSHDFLMGEGFHLLEEKYALVYWDQRMTGMSQGNPSRQKMTIEQHVEDLHKIVLFIESKYHPVKLYLLGHSWGGALATRYLGEGQFQQRFQGWINVAGGLSDSLNLAYKRDFLLDRAAHFINQNQDTAYWKNVQKWFANHPTYQKYDIEPYEFTDRAGGFVYDRPNYNEITQQHIPKMVFFSPYSTAYLQGRKFPLLDDRGLDLSAYMKKIQIPSLFIWGDQDGTVPVKIGEVGFKLIGTPANQKKRVLLKHCGHVPYAEQAASFAREIVDFMK